MRFFKSFSLLHRRTKSDSSVPGRAQSEFTPATLESRRPQSLPDVFSPVNPAFVYPDSNPQFLALESENAQLKSQLAAVRTELYATLHRSHVQSRALSDMVDKLTDYERFLNLTIILGAHQRVLGAAHAAMRAGEDPDAALVKAIKDAANVPGSPWKGIMEAVNGKRTQEEYLSALRMTLRVRRESRGLQKVAKFWKRSALAALEGVEAASGMVTPSVSTISSVCEVLSEERQHKVDELITRRRGSPVPKQVLLSESSISKPSGSTSSSFTLAPLASDSFKEELASLASNSRLSKRTKILCIIEPDRSSFSSDKALGKRKADADEVCNVSFFESTFDVNAIQIMHGELTSTFPVLSISESSFEPLITAILPSGTSSASSTGSISAKDTDIAVITEAIVESPSSDSLSQSLHPQFLSRGPLFRIVEEVEYQHQNPPIDSRTSEWSMLNFSPGYDVEVLEGPQTVSTAPEIKLEFPNAAPLVPAVLRDVKNVKVTKQRAHAKTGGGEKSNRKPLKPNAKPKPSSLNPRPEKTTKLAMVPQPARVLKHLRRISSLTGAGGGKRNEMRTGIPQPKVKIREKTMWV